jgi:hypothetical protein
MSSSEGPPALEASSRSVSPMHSTTTLESIRQCLNFALEMEDCSAIPTSPNVANKTHETKCGYARRDGSRSWQIRYKPFGKIQTGVLAGAGDDPSKARVLTSVAIAHFDPSNEAKTIPRMLVLFSLKCTELRHLLEEGRKFLRKKRAPVQQLPTTSRLDGGTTIDLGPLFLPLLGTSTQSTADLIQLIDMAVACTYLENFQEITGADWKIRSHKKEANLIKYASETTRLEAVSDVIRECLQPGLYAADTSSRSAGKGTHTLETPSSTQRSSRKRQRSTPGNITVDVATTDATPERPNRETQQVDATESMQIKTAQKHAGTKPSIEQLPKYDGKKEDPKSTPAERPTRVRKSISPFDATPWTLEQKAKKMEERGIVSKSLKKAPPPGAKPMTMTLTKVRRQVIEARIGAKTLARSPPDDSEKPATTMVRKQALPEDRKHFRSAQVLKQDSRGIFEKGTATKAPKSALTVARKDHVTAQLVKFAPPEAREECIRANAPNKVPSKDAEPPYDETKPKASIAAQLTKPGTRASYRRQRSLPKIQLIRTSSRIRSKARVAYEDNEEEDADEIFRKPAGSTSVKKPPATPRRAVAAAKPNIAESDEDDEEGADLDHGDHWSRLDYRGLISDYKYHDFDPVDFGYTIESASEAIWEQLEVLKEKNLSSVDDEAFVAETKMYSRSMQERRQKSDSERIEKERNRDEYEKRVMEYHYYGTKKRSAEDLELEAFAERPVHFAQREPSRNLVCPKGLICDYCTNPDDEPGAQERHDLGSDIFLPFVRPSDIRDTWRESTAGMEAEPIGKAKSKTTRSRRTGRNSNKAQHAFYMLNEMKHSLHFIQMYNRGYFEQDE